MPSNLPPRVRHPPSSCSCYFSFCCFATENDLCDIWSAITVFLLFFARFRGVDCVCLIFAVKSDERLYCNNFYENYCDAKEKNEKCFDRTFGHFVTVCAFCFVSNPTPGEEMPVLICLFAKLALKTPAK